MAPFPPPTSTRSRAADRSHAALTASTWRVARRAMAALNTASSGGWASSQAQFVIPVRSS